jgi:hypothetical protein
VKVCLVHAFVPFVLLCTFVQFLFMQALQHCRKGSFPRACPAGGAGSIDQLQQAGAAAVGMLFAVCDAMKFFAYVILSSGCPGEMITGVGAKYGR